jgi:hypothetical protein
MQTVTGKVESMRQDRKGIKVNGEWYAAFASSQLKGIEWKDEVTFQVATTEKNGKTYKNIKGDVEKAGGGSSTTAPSASPAVMAAAAVWPQPVDARSRSIIRQNSMSNAVKYAAAFMQDGGASPDDVVAVARVFEAYCTGESDSRDDQPFTDDEMNF